MQVAEAVGAVAVDAVGWRRAANVPFIRPVHEADRWQPTS